MFEGFFDFLSTLVYYGQTQPNANVLVLNSVSMIDRATDRLKGQGIHTLYTYLDHDAAGEAAKSHLEAQHFKVQNASKFYHGHKDANDMLMAARQWYYEDLPYDVFRKPSTPLEPYFMGDEDEMQRMRCIAREYREWLTREEAKRRDKDRGRDDGLEK